MLPSSFLRSRTRRQLSWGMSLAGILTGLTVLQFAVSGCGRREPKAATPPPVAPTATPLVAKSADCRSCHEAAYQAWSDSHHAHAHRPVDATADAAAFSPARSVTVEGVTYDLNATGSQPQIAERRGEAPGPASVVEFVLGYTPLRQYVIPVGGGRYQMTELAFDPAKQDWFNVFGSEQRKPGEWGHWQGRGMNWNSMCAHCHLTAFEKNYQPSTDTYGSTWSEHGVGCAQCHGNLPASHATAPRKTGPILAERQRAQETCAPCHARNELLTGSVTPGVSYTDHYRLTLPVETGVFHPDGQVREEDFNMTSLLLSRMGGKAGVTCLDCHEPHSGKTRLPAANNALCLQCHGTPASRPDAIAIDPLAHSHHAAGSAGNQCVSCHMPTTTYMQRDPRHDHGFLKPDPLLTKELGIPNACNRCHTDRDVDWAIAATDKWYGPKMESRQRERARAVASAQKGEATSATPLLSLLRTEDIPAWRATLLLLARPFANTMPEVVTAARGALGDADPMVRSAAVQVLGGLTDQRGLVEPQLKDPSRLVRLDAAWALSDRLPASSSERLELDRYLATMADQPAGQLRLAQDYFNRGQLAESEAAVRKAADWDPNSSVIFATLGTVLNAAGRDRESAAAFWRAAQKDPTDANAAFSAALAFAAAGQLPDTELALREATRRDARHERAWYNLGLVLAQTARPAEALEALANAERLGPTVADYPYARATVLLNRGDRVGGAAALRRTLEIDPAHREAAGLLQRLGN